jgi:hypothetical protein
LNQADPESLTQELVETCKLLQPVKLTNQMKLAPHGRQVVTKVIEENGLTEFIRMWRLNFLENEPKYLPVGWRIDHKFERKFGEMSQFENPNTGMQARLELLQK